eukprot:Pgem_evm1s13217
MYDGWRVFFLMSPRQSSQLVKNEQAEMAKSEKWINIIKSGNSYSIPECCFDANLQDADFTGVDLSGIDFTNADLSGAIFVNAVLTGTNFKGANLDGARFIDERAENINISRREKKNFVLKPFGELYKARNVKKSVFFAVKDEALKKGFTDEDLELADQL